VWTPDWSKVNAGLVEVFFWRFGRMEQNTTSLMGSDLTDIIHMMNCLA
jgi:hypothetical protein